MASRKREIITLHVGQAGTQIGGKCWELYCLEHGISLDGSCGLPTAENLGLFRETKDGGKFKARSVFFDSDPSVIDVFRTGPQRNLFDSDQLISGQEDSGSIFARAKYAIGSRYMAGVFDRIRLLTEETDRLQGIIVHHSFGGGTGSGFTSLLLTAIADEFPKLPKFLYTVFPSLTTTSAVVEPYNTVLMTKAATDFADCGVMVENQSIYDFLRRKLSVHYPHLSQTNIMIAQLASALTASMRFGGLLNIDLNEFSTNLVPFPRVHYLIGSQSPICPMEKRNQESAETLTDDCFKPENHLFPCNVNFGKYIACCMMYRGDIVPRDVNTAINTQKDQHNFVKWCPTSFKVGLISRPMVRIADSGVAYAPRSLTLLANTTAISKVWDILGRNFDKLYAKNAFTHWYTMNGLEMDEMQDARYDLAVLENDYLEIEHFLL